MVGGRFIATSVQQGATGAASIVCAVNVTGPERAVTMVTNVAVTTGSAAVGAAVTAAAAAATAVGGGGVVVITATVVAIVAVLF